ncbi:MAG TPA: SDR family oxidoreductase [Chloroflexota bacterium]|nr:SDR family oxidoreductase [Chloroflexota bacterium]
MDLGLRDRVAIVGGSSKGIGRATAEVLASEGAKVVINGRDPEALETTCAEIAKTGAELEAVPADVSTEQGARHLIDRAVERFGRIDILVTNAGGPPAGSLESLTDQQWLDGFELVVLTMVRLIRAALPHLRESQGSIVAVNSMAALHAVGALTISNVVRPAQLGVARTLVRELAESNIRINEVGPGLILTDRQRYLATVRAHAAGISIEEEMRQVVAGVPLKRYGSPEDLGRLVAFLASPAAAYITGQLVLVDGGLVPS